MEHRGPQIDTLAPAMRQWTRDEQEQLARVYTACSCVVVIALLFKLFLSFCVEDHSLMKELTTNDRTNAQAQLWEESDLAATEVEGEAD